MKWKGRRVSNNVEMAVPVPKDPMLKNTALTGEQKKKFPDTMKVPPIKPNQVTPGNWKTDRLKKQYQKKTS